jgi:hypothetical protein
MQPARPRAGIDRDEGVPAPSLLNYLASPPYFRIPTENEKNSDFLKCAASKSLERDEANQINHLI